MSDLDQPALEGVAIPPERQPTLDEMIAKSGREVGPAERRMYEAFLAGEPIPEITVPSVVVADSELSDDELRARVAEEILGRPPLDHPALNLYGYYRFGASTIDPRSFGISGSGC